jgi:ribosomal protein S18 acetylase RimI-like enzyme
MIRAMSVSPIPAADGLRIRPVTAEDAAGLVPLLDQLGYRLDVPEIQQRIRRILGDREHCLLLAESEDVTPQALLHVYGRSALEKPPEAVVQALVVRDTGRGRGLGRRMMALAEEWAAGRGYRYVSLSSQTSRRDAHAFYEGLGYARYATSHQYRKTIGG